MNRLVLSLFDRTRVWSEAFAAYGYEVEALDLTRGDDVRLARYRDCRVDVVLAAPPCTEFAVSGARWWKAKGIEPLLHGLSLVDAALRAVALYQPRIWAIENPVGRLRDYLGAPQYRFDPCDFAGWADDPDAEAYTKRTCLWGQFAEPDKAPLPAILGSKMHRLPPSEDRAALRSATPSGFARAFAAANAHLEPTP